MIHRVRLVIEKPVPHNHRLSSLGKPHDANRRFSEEIFLSHPGDKNISILHSPCRTSDLQFSLVLQTHALVLKNCMGGGMFLKFLISLLKSYLPTAVSFITASHTLTKRILHSILSLMLQLSFSKSRLFSVFFCSRHFSRITTVKKKIQ